MVEEATGVSMYESKKKSTRATIEKKDHAIRNIDNLINETIQPKLEQLTQEQSSLLQYQKVCIELENLTKIHTAWTFVQYEEASQQTDSKIKDKSQEIDKIKEEIESLGEKSSQLEEQISSLVRKKDQEFGGKLANLEDELKDAQMNEAKLIGELNVKNDNLNEVTKQKTQLVKSLKADNNVLNAKQFEYEKLRESFDKLEETRNKNIKALEQAQKDFEAIASGLSRGQDGEAAASLADQLIQAKRSVANADTEIKKSKMKAIHCESELKKKRQEVKTQKGDYENDLKVIAAMENDLNQLTSSLKKINFNEEYYNQLASEKTTLNNELYNLQESLRGLEKSIPQAQFSYRSPNDPSFDRAKVFGPVCTLFKVKDPKFFAALEAVAGGKLSNIVVADKDTGKLILEKGQLPRRYTFLPLDAIRGRDIDQQTFKNAERLVGRGNVFLASDLVTCDERFSEVKKFVFGGTLVCPNKSHANQITFARDVRTRSVTFEGDIFDPAGTLTGGARGQKGNLLAGVSELLELRDQAKEIEVRLKDVESTLESMHVSTKRYNEIKEQYDLKLHEIELRKSNLKQTNEAMLLEEIQRLEESIEENNRMLDEFAKSKENYSKRIEELEYKIKHTKSIRDKELKEAELNLEKAKKDCESNKANVLEKEQEVYQLKLEIEELKKSIESSDHTLAELENSIVLHQKEVDSASKIVEKAKESADYLKEQVKEQKRILNAHSTEINKLIKQKESTSRQIENDRLQIKKLKHEIHLIENEGKDAAKTVHAMLKKYQWISQERHLFGEKNSGYDFKSNDFMPEKIEGKLKSLQTTKANLSKTVNMRANIMLGDKQKESEELDKKRQIIELDKKKLLRYMEEVDKKKQDALHDAWLKINTDFGNIFSTLLPGANAKLAPPDGQTIVNGLEVKVAFGDVWKESLTELSGGQRSLVALSLILALLLYNPAPLYILDEVDAALDQSHTTNIGAMIKKHFTNSQVSRTLK